MNDQMLRTYLRLEEILSDPSGTSAVVKVSALTGENLEGVMKWLAIRTGVRVSHTTILGMSSRHEPRIYPIVE